MKIATISGPHGAGKDAISAELVKRFSHLPLYKVVPCTTRSMRNGEREGDPYHFITESEFEGGIQAGEFVFNSQIRNHRSGFKKEELYVSPFVLIDILPVGARLVRELVKKEQWGNTFHVFIDVPSELRRIRIIRREPSIVLLPQKLKSMLEADPVSSNPCLYQDFDFVTGNPDGKLDETVNRISELLERFF